MTEPKKLSSSLRPLIESILKKAQAAGNISPETLANRIKDLDLIDAGKKPTNKKAGGLAEATAKLKAQGLKKGGEAKVKNKSNKSSKKSGSSILDVFKSYGKYDGKPIELKSGGRAGYRKGGGVCLRGMNREAVGKNS